MANRGPRPQNPFSQWEDVQAMYEKILRHDRFVIPLLVPITLIPMVSAWAVNAAFKPAGAWYDPYASGFAMRAMFVTVVGLMTMGTAWSLAAAAYRADLDRRQIFQWIGIGVSAAIAVTYQLFIADYGPSRQDGTYRIVVKGEALIEGIDRFRTQYGRIPDRLDELSPGFVEATGVGLAGYSTFDYSRPIGGDTYTLSMSLFTWPQGQTRIVYRSAPPANAHDPSVRYGEWNVEDDGPKR